MSEKDIFKDYLTIKEFSKYVGISTSALRHYDKVDAFVPAKHGMGLDNNYRYYSPLQITTAKMIRVMREIGVPLSTIKELKENRTPEKLLKLLTKHSNNIAEEVRVLHDISSVMSVYTELLYEAISVTENELSNVEMSERQLLLGDKITYSDEDGFLREFIRFCNTRCIPKLNLSFPIGGFWDNMSAFRQESSRPERFFSLDPKGSTTKAAEDT